MHRTCTIDWAAVATWGPERSPIETNGETWKPEFPQVRHHLMQVYAVVRSGIEPPTFRFSGGLAGPLTSVAAHLSTPHAELALSGIRARHLVSVAVVSAALAARQIRRTVRQRCGKRP